MIEDDPQREWNRLSELYGSLSDSELGALRADSADLTHIAQQVLSAELRRRDLDPSNDNISARTDDDEFVEVARFRDFAHASLLQGFLESAGIETKLLDSTMSTYVGARIAVKQRDLTDAEELIKSPIPPSFDVPGVGLFQQPECPKCRSLDISFGLPPAEESGWIEASPERWICHACNTIWEDEETDAK